MKKLIQKLIKKIGIQGKLTFIFILISTLPLLLIGIYTVQEQIDYRKEQNLRDMDTDIKGLKVRTSLFLTQIKSEILLIIKNTDLDKLLLDKNKSDKKLIHQSLKHDFKTLISENDFYSRITLFNNRGKEILKLIDKNDSTYIFTESELSKSSRLFYVHAVRNSFPGDIQIYPSEIKDEITGEVIPIFDIIIPVFNNNEKPFAIALANIKAEKLFEIMVPSSNQPGNMVYIANGEGYYLYHSERKTDWNLLFTNKEEENLHKDFSNEIAEQILSGIAGTINIKNESIIQFAPIFSGSKSKTNQYFIIEKIPAEIVLPGLENFKLVLIVSLISLTFISIIIGYSTARHFLNPVKKLIAGTEIIRSGNLDYRLDIKTNDEIDTLVNGFNQLVKEWKDKQKLEKQVRKTEQLFHTLAQTAKDAILVVTNSGTITVWNDEATRLFGYSESESLLLDIKNLFLDKDLNNPVFIEGIREFYDNGSGRLIDKTLELFAKNKNGSKVPVELSFSSKKIEGTWYATCIIRDITNRKLYEEKIRKLSRAVEESPVSIIITNSEGKIEFANPKTIELTGFSFDELNGENPKIFKSGKMDENIYKELWETICAGKIWKGEILNKKKDGSFFWELSSIFPLKNKESRITHFVAFKEDITEQKKFLKQLKESKEKAEKSDKLKGEFLAQMSHEIRTPLNAVISISGILIEELEDKVDEELKDLLNRIHNAGFRIIRTVELLLNYSEVSTGSYQPGKSKINFPELCESVVRELRNLSEENNIRVTFENKMDQNIIETDEYAVKQSVKNIIENAIIYNEKGEVKITISNNDNDAEFICTDTGIGISKEYLTKIFEPFTQEDEGYTRKYEGNGLGLALVKKYCDLNNIKIKIKSKKNVGSAFKLEIKNSVVKISENIPG